ncbi:enoyl-CoA hydratase-related protein [Actinomadura viridis]|uniref:enoyl-CoA hydratase-related protein n=1 Tax=Actinomadura viridis TaxID=58110 RepID=UPI0036AAA44D
MAVDTLRIEDRDRVRTLTFDRPRAANAFDEALYNAVAAALVEAAGDAGVSVVLLTGTGGTFTAGTGRWITAEEAVESGLALRTCPHDELMETAHGLAAEIAARPLASLLATKWLITEAHRDGVRRAREREDAAFAELLRRDGAAGDVLARLD